MNTLENYLKNILTSQLADFEVPSVAISKITANIKLQMYSLLQIWNDSVIKNTVLLLGLEEGKFYDSDALDSVKSFVVVTIRNSMFETIASVGFETLGLKRMVSDDEVKMVTSAAVDYFTGVDFEKLSSELDYTNINNLYLMIKDKYPSAWKAMEVLANSEKCNTHYPKTNYTPESALLDKVNTSDINKVSAPEKNDTVTLDGYTEELDDMLIDYLKNVITHTNSVFFSSCFKMISRNIEKLFRIIDFVLCFNKPCVTMNYLIINGHVERRNPLIRAGHGSSEVSDKLKNFDGLQTKHARILKCVKF